MLRRRLTALLVGVLLLPSTAMSGGSRCAMAGDESHGEHAPPAHHGAHRAGETVSAIPDGSGLPAPPPEAPMECVVTACAGAGVAASSILVIDRVHVTDRVGADVALAPESPARGLEPPPPRA